MLGTLDNPHCFPVPRHHAFVDEVDQFERDEAASENKQANSLERIQVLPKKMHSCRNIRLILRPTAIEKNNRHYDVRTLTQTV